MSEKKLAYILFSVAFVAILIVILVSIPWGGDKARINREYDSLEDKNHVFVTISFDDVMSNIEKGKTFQLYIGSSELQQGEQFVYETNELAKKYKIDTIYYLHSDDLTDEQITKIKNESDNTISFPTLIYWEEDGTRSTAFHISSLKNFERDYNSNWNDLLTEYFENCYE